MKKLVWAVLLLFCFVNTAQAEDYKEGTHYQRIETPQSTETGDKVEVLEFFWYGCPHCNVFDPILEDWIENKMSPDAEFVRIPTVFRPEWKVHARAYYALQVMGEGEKYHAKIFNEIHKNRKRIDTLDSMSDFLEKEGVDKKAFTEAYNSFTVDNSVRKAIKKLQAYKITGVPTLAVNGKYIVSGKSAGSYENMLRIADFLISKEQAAR